jgi:predicted house-cleaning noncanonical NTP pyrophosphatase (MazG superfamily)
MDSLSCGYDNEKDLVDTDLSNVDQYEITFRQDLSSQIFVKLIEEVSEYTPKDRFNEIADLAVYAADALINRLKNNDR